MRKILLTLFALALVLSSFAQERTVSGRVTDPEDGSALPGVSVVLKGTNIGTVTDSDGFYTLSSPASGGALVFTFIGRATQEVDIGSQSSIDVQLRQDVTQLSEVVVVGYSTTTQQAFTGSAKVVTSDDLLRKNVSNVTRALAGEVAGVSVINNSGQPGSKADVRIRGFGSVNGNRDPLYVIDGVPFQGDLNSINPSDIESTTVLKDAAATAIYGARGANGVILINTRTGKGKKPFIEIDAQVGTNTSLLPRYDVIRSPEQFIGLGWEALYNQARANGVADPTTWANLRLFSTSGIAPGYNMWDVPGQNLIDPETRNVRDGVNRKYTPENWEDHAFQSSARKQVDIKFGGSHDKSNYFTSFGYLDDKGYSINSDFQRLSARFNLHQEITSWVNTNLTLNYARTKTNRGGQSQDSGSIFWFVDNMPPIYPLYRKDTEGNNIPDPIFGGPQFDYGNDPARKFGSLTNAIADATYDIQGDNRNELNGSASLNFNIVEGLTMENRLGLQYFNNKYILRNNKYYGSAATQNGSIYSEREEMFSYNVLNLLRYSKTFGTHGIEALVAHESTEWTNETLQISAFNLVDPGLTDFNNAVVSNPIDSYTESFSLQSFFGQVSYDFKKTYFLSASLRRDGSSRFLKDKWANFGSVGAGWLISNESFMKGVDIVKTLKLKASYGLIGEQAGIGYYPGYDLYNVDNLNDGPAFSFDTKGNPDLTWETSKMFQAGVEFSLGNFLTGSVDYYVKNTTDLIFDRRVGPSIGYALIKVNDGELRNSGVEFDLTGHLLKTDNAYIDLSVNGELLKNKLTKMPIDPATNKQKVLDVQVNYAYGVGHSIFDFYLREYAGVDPEDGRSRWTVYYQDLDSDGMFDTGEQVTSLTQFRDANPDVVLLKGTTKTYAQATQMYVGKSAIPKIRGAVNLAGGYKGFELSVQMLYRFGGYAYDGAYAALMGNGLIGGNNWHTDIVQRWQNQGDVTDVPRLSNQLDANVSSASTRWLTKANYLLLNNVRLGYNIPSTLLKGLRINSASVWVSGDNLWIKSKREGLNPSTAEAGSSSTYRYSPLSTFSAGIKAKL